MSNDTRIQVKLRAISTVYNGTKFRSRLEASFAQHFDQRGMPWVYEPEAFALSDGTNYLPDFWLPTARTWVEIKGPHNERIDKVERFAADLSDNGRRAVDELSAPIVALFSPPGTPMLDGSGCYLAPQPLIVRSVGKRVSGGMALCTVCRARTVIALWQKRCRHCGTQHDTPHLGWDVWDWSYEVPFRYISSGYRR